MAELDHNIAPVLVIPSAKLVPVELQFMGKLPSVIYPIDQRMVFDYLYELYRDQCEYIQIACYEKAELVEHALASYMNAGVFLKKLPELRDLGYSIYQIIKDIRNPIMINFGDTIVFDDIPNASDAIFYAEDHWSEEWTFFVEEAGIIKELYDKTEEKRTGVTKIFVGLFRLSDTEFFARCLETAFDQPWSAVDSFYQAIALYSRRHPFAFFNAHHWLDIGHMDRYYESKLQVKAREFNHIIVDQDRGILTKTSDNKAKLIDEIKWYLKLPADIEYVSPRIFHYALSFDHPYVSMEYYSYHTLHELFLYSDLDDQQWEKIFRRILFVHHDLKRYSVSEDNFVPSLKEMYMDKTFQRLDSMRTMPEFRPFFEREITVNGTVYFSLSKIISLLQEVIPIELFHVDRFSIIHGDLCFSNILIDTSFSFIKLIDPRGRFGKMDIFGDARYDLAKLMHSVDGKYDYIIKDLFSLDYDSKAARIDFQIQRKADCPNLYQIFLKIFANEIGDDRKKIELIEALLFFSMIPLHAESPRHQIVMLGTALEILGRILNIKVSEADKRDVQ